MSKVFKNGNSLVVTVPRNFARQLRMRDGSRVEWDKTDKGLVLTLEDRPKNSQDIDPEVAKLIKKISQKYAQTWEELSKR